MFAKWCIKVECQSVRLTCMPDKETTVTMGDLLGLVSELAIGCLAVIASLHIRCGRC
jgi:hypothetical protein